MHEKLPILSIQSLRRFVFVTMNDQGDINIYVGRVKEATDPSFRNVLVHTRGHVPRHYLKHAIATHSFDRNRRRNPNMKYSIRIFLLKCDPDPAIPKLLNL